MPGRWGIFGSTDYLWDGDLMMRSRRGSKELFFLFEPDGFVPLATIQNSEIFWYHCDQIGTPYELTDSNGEIMWAEQYQAWGNAEVGSATIFDLGLASNF